MTNYEQRGIEARLHDLEGLLQLVEEEIERLRARLAPAKNGGARDRAEDLHRFAVSLENNNGEKQIAKGRAQRSYWSSMSPDERSDEMKRRFAKRKDKRAGPPAAAAVDPEKLHPRDPRSPRHEAWRKKMRQVNRKTWANYTPEERAARLAAAKHGRAAA